MIDVRPFSQLGRFKNHWLNAHYHFSFSGYYDPARLGWGSILVWNDDEIEPHTGFDTHPHQDMEIVTYVRTGAISHKDSLGNSGKTSAGDVQVMSAGSGISHSERNNEDERTTLYQIWIAPAEKGIKPRWDAAQFPKNAGANGFEVLASGFPEDEGKPYINQAARVLGAKISAGQTITYEAQPDRHLYLGLSEGAIEINGKLLTRRDGAAITGETTLTIVAADDSEMVLVDAP